MIWSDITEIQWTNVIWLYFHRNIVTLRFATKRCIPRSCNVSTKNVKTFVSLTAYHQKDKRSAIPLEQSIWKLHCPNKSLHT